MPRPKKKPEAGAQGASFYEIAEQALALERRGKDIVRLNVGDTNLPVPQRAKDAAAKSMRDGRGGYGSSRGSEELLSLIAAREKCGIENVVVGPGSKHLLFALLSVLCKKGDSVAFPSPHWPAYSLACAQLGLRAKTKDTLLGNAWQFETLPKAKLAIICNPLNPASTIHGHESVSSMRASAGRYRTLAKQARASLSTRHTVALHSSRFQHTTASASAPFPRNSTWKTGDWATRLRPRKQQRSLLSSTR